MNFKTKAGFAGGVAALLLLAIPLVRHFSDGGSPSPSTTPDTTKDHVSESASRPPRSTAWKLPFRLKPRLTDEQAAVLASGEVGPYLRAHPENDDLLVAWAAADPQAAERWLKAAGEIVVDDIGYYQSHLAALAAGSFAHGGIAEMQALLERQRQDPLLPPKYQDGGFDSHPWFKLGREDTGAEAIAYLQAHPEKTDLAGAFLNGIEDTGRMLAAFDYLHAKGMPSDLDHWQLGERADKDGTMLADWAAAKHPDLLGDVLLAWRPGNDEKVRRWIEQNASRPDLAPALREIAPFLEGSRDAGEGEE